MSRVALHAQDNIFRLNAGLLSRRTRYNVFDNELLEINSIGKNDQATLVHLKRLLLALIWFDDKLAVVIIEKNAEATQQLVSKNAIPEPVFADQKFLFYVLKTCDNSRKFNV